MRNPNKFGSVYKLKDKPRRKPWVARVTTGWTTHIATKGEHKGQEVPKQEYKIIGYYKNRSDALNALSDYHTSPAPPPKADITLGELYKEWSEQKFNKLSRDTVSNYRAAWSRINVLQDSKFKELRTAHWQGLIDEYKSSLGHSALKKMKSLASSLYSYALQNDIVSRNYAEFVELPKEEKKVKKIFSDTEIQKMFKKAADVPYLDTVLIMIYTGMRISEMLQLTAFNIDLNNEIITGGIKTEAGKDRVIPIHPKIMPYIKAWYEFGGETLICRMHDKKAMTAKYYRENYYYPALKAAEVTPLVPHSCRHTFASRMSEAGVEAVYTQRIIGHADFAFTYNEYTHPEIEEYKKAIKKLK